MVNTNRGMTYFQGLTYYFLNLLEAALYFLASIFNVHLDLMWSFNYFSSIKNNTTEGSIETADSIAANKFAEALKGVNVSKEDI